MSDLPQTKINTHTGYLPAIDVHIDLFRLSRLQMEAVQARVFDCVEDDDDRRTILCALFQPPRETRIDSDGRKIYGRL